MEIIKLSLKEVMPSDQNTRADLNGAAMAELMNSITQVGLLSPIIVRKCGDMGYEIVAGHRRYQAHRNLNLYTIEARLIQATDEEAAQIRLIENLQRKDLNAIEEAEAFAQLRDHHAMTPAMIAERSDKTLPYVTRALALLFLPPAVVKAIRGGDLTAEHGHQIARAPKEKFDKLAAFALTVNSWSKRGPTVDELKHEIEKHIEKPLMIAPFPLDVPNYGGTAQGACDGCPFNTGNQGALFDGAKAGACTNGGCYTKRWNAAFKEMADKRAKFWPSVPYLGVKTSGYNHTFMGHPEVDEKKVKKELAAHPERFAFGFEKPSTYGPKRTRPVLVRVHADPTAKTKPQQPEHDWERERFIEGAIQEALVAMADRERVAVPKPALIAMIGAEDPKPLEKLSREELIKGMWLRWLSEYEQAYTRMVESGFSKKDLKTITDRAMAKAATEYDEAKKKSAKEKVNE